MASKITCIDLKYNFFNGGWSNWSTDLWGGYAGKEKYVAVLAFKVPSVTNSVSNTSLSIRVPYHRQGSSGTSDKKGTLYVKLYTSDPTGKYMTTGICDIPTASTCDASYNFEHSDTALYSTTLTFNKTLKENTTYYLVFGTNTNHLVIGSKNAKGTEKDWLVTLNYTEYTNGSVGKPTIIDNGNNTFTLRCSYTNGTNNKLRFGRIYYTTDGSAPTTSSSYVAISGVTLSVPPSAASSVVKAFAYGVFAHNTVSSSVVNRKVLYHKYGSKPATPTIKDNGNNTATISGTVGSAGWNNAMSSATIYYNVAGTAYTKALSTTSGASYSFNITLPSSNDVVIITAYVKCVYECNTTTSETATAFVKYYSAISKPGIFITDNYDNTFTIRGINASDGINNTATTSFAWDYSTSYSNSGLGIKTLTIATPSNATRTVYAKATATPSWSGDSAKTSTVSLAVKQYVAPSAPGAPVISYSKSRLTIKENWTFTWPAAVQANSSSPMKGYRIRLYKNGANIPIKDASGKVLSTIRSGSTDDYIYDTESTGTSIIINPVLHNFKAGDTVQLGIYSYTRHGLNNDRGQMFNGGGTGAAQVSSSVTTVRNAGIVHVKPNGTWVEGQVYVKVNGAWAEADIVNTNVNGVWKESE
jgi:hypothetical protein